MDLKEAMDALDLPAVWDLAANPNGTPPPVRGGVMKSPLRADHKGKSFSVDRELRVFKDHAEPSHRGGVWKFVELAKPEWSKSEIAREIIRRAGGDPDAKDPNYKPKSKTQLKQEKQALQEKMRARQKRDNLKLEKVPDEKIAAWPDGKKTLWNWLNVMNGPAFLAEERGWPMEWVEELVESEKLRSNNRDEPVFAVERVDEDGKVHFCGTHTRWQPEGEIRKAWAYRPNFNKDGRDVAALPFVLGPVNTNIWLVTEGQWDAATAYGLLGGFDDVMRIEACCWGIRGVSGVDVFLDVYARRLRSQRPVVVLVPDADKAARRWTEDLRGKWCFMRRLKEITGAPVAALKLKARPGMKDLNDFYKNKALSAGQFEHMVRSAVEAAEAV